MCVCEGGEIDVDPTSHDRVDHVLVEAIQSF